MYVWSPSHTSSVSPNAVAGSNSCLHRCLSAYAQRYIVKFATRAVPTGKIALNMPMWKDKLKSAPATPTADRSSSNSLATLRTSIHTTWIKAGSPLGFRYADSEFVFTLQAIVVFLHMASRRSPNDLLMNATAAKHRLRRCKDSDNTPLISVSWNHLPGRIRMSLQAKLILAKVLKGLNNGSAELSGNKFSG